MTRSRARAALTLSALFVAALIIGGSPAVASTGLNAKVYGPHGAQCFWTNTVLPYQFDWWNKSQGVMDTLDHRKQCTAFSYDRKSGHLLQAGYKNRCLTQDANADYLIKPCKKGKHPAQQAFFSTVDHGKYAEIHFRYEGSNGKCVTFNPLPGEAFPANLAPEGCNGHNEKQYWRWVNPIRKHHHAVQLARVVLRPYSRNYQVVIDTRHGVWAAFCHNYRNVNRFIRIYGGCLPPRKQEPR